jgi:heme exporter protein A
MVAAMGDAASIQEFAGSRLACRRGERLVFAGLDFRLGSGEALVLRGPNGSGKSSLLRLMAGLIRPEAGRLTWNGAATAEDREAHGGRLHFIGHLDAVKPALTVRENLRFWIRLRGVAEDASAIGKALARLGLERLADAPARFLSAGQRRRLALSRLAATPAALWLLDEPSTGLDDASLSAFESLLADHRAGGGMVALATHTAIALPGAAELRLDAFARGPVLDDAA